jgi:hypothetical protein
VWDKGEWRNVPHRCLLIASWEPNRAALSSYLFAGIYDTFRILARNSIPFERHYEAAYATNWYILPSGASSLNLLVSIASKN